MRAVEDETCAGANRWALDLGRLTNRETVEVEQLAIAQGHCGPSFVSLGELADGAKSGTRSGVDDERTSRHWSAVVVEDFAELRGVAEGRGKRGDRGGSSCTGCALIESIANVGFHLIDEDAEGLRDLVLLDG